MKKGFESINKKVMKMLMAIVILFVIASSFCSFCFFKDLLFDKSAASMQQEFTYAQSMLQNTVRNYLSGSAVIQGSEEIQELLQMQPQGFVEEYQMQEGLEKALYEVTLPLLLNQIAVYVEDEYTFSNNRVTFRPLSELYAYEEYEMLSNSNDSFVWLKPEYINMGYSTKDDEVISFIRKVGSNKDPVGYQRATIKCKDIADIIQIGTQYDAVTCVYMKENGHLLTWSEDNEETVAVSKEELQTFLQGEDAETASNPIYKSIVTSKWEYYTIAGETYYCYRQNVKSTDWVMLTMLPVKNILKDVLRLENLWIAVAIFVGVIGMFLGIRIGRRVTGKIQLLESDMKRVQKGDFSIQEYSFPEKRYDEVDELFRHYNYMLQKINEMFEQQEKDASEKRILELSVMQQQINPHFLYNTLDMIHWKALDLGAAEINNITMALSHFYRLTLNNGKEKMKLRDELRHVEDYVVIQNYRFEYFIRLNWDVPETLLDVELPKLTLQPLIENAIQHGLMPKKKRKNSWIEIYAWRESEYVFIQVCDNGVGMSPEKCSKIFVEESSSLMHGYGVRNINDRLKLYYGQECGLMYESTEGKGCAVTIKIKENPTIQDGKIS